MNRKTLFRVSAVGLLALAILVPTLVSTIFPPNFLKSFFNHEAKAQTLDPAVQAQINSLLALVAQLRAQLALLETGQVCTELTRDLFFGIDDARSGGQVSKLQQFLKTKGLYTYPTITGYFGGGTQSAVQRFQASAGIVSYGTPASTGYGFVGPTTRSRIKTQSCPAELVIPPPAPPAPAPVTPPPAPPQPASPQCGDSLDNDRDGYRDYPADIGCTSLSDNDETNTVPPPPPPPQARQCNDRSDNDSDTLIDYPSDPGCSSATDNNEYNEPIPPPPPPPPPGAAECNDASDNDNDDTVDFPRDPGCRSASDTSEDNDPLLLVLENVGNAVWDINDNEGLGGEKTYIVYGGFVDPEHDGIINVSLFERYIRGETPSDWDGFPSNFHGYVAIDIEYPFAQWLREPPSSAHFQQAQAQIAVAMQTAKALRPDIKWGIYALPTTPYWLPGQHGWATAPASVRQTFIDQMLAATQAYEAVDFLAPDIYDHYPNASYPANIQQDLAYVQNIVRTAVQAANGKPVFPFVSHRYFNGTDPDSYSLVEPSELQLQQVETSLGAGADGIFWWGADHYYYACAFANPPYCPDSNLIRTNFGAEIPEGMSSDEYFTRLHEHILRYFAEEMFNIPFDPPGLISSGDSGQRFAGLSFLSQVANVFQAFLNFLRQVFP